MPKSNRNDMRITLAPDEMQMLDLLCDAWNIPTRTTVARKIIVDQLKDKERSGVIPGARPGQYPPDKGDGK